MNDKTKQNMIPEQRGRPYGLVNGSISRWFETAGERDAYARSRRNYRKWERVDNV